jgi:hypothetical protein
VEFTVVIRCIPALDRSACCGGRVVQQCESACRGGRVVRQCEQPVVEEGECYVVNLLLYCVICINP